VQDSRRKSFEILLLAGLRKDFRGRKLSTFWKEGILTLIKSVLLSIPTYFFSLFPIPSLVVGTLEAIQRSFLWGSFGSDFKYDRVQWNIVKQPVTQGGLRVREMRLFNELSLVSDFGDLRMRKMIFGERQLQPNMVRQALDVFIHS